MIADSGCQSCHPRFLQQSTSNDGFLARCSEELSKAQVSFTDTLIGLTFVSHEQSPIDWTSLKAATKDPSGGICVVQHRTDQRRMDISKSIHPLHRCGNLPPHISMPGMEQLHCYSRYGMNAKSSHYCCGYSGGSEGMEKRRLRQVLLAYLKGTELRKNTPQLQIATFSVAYR
ncbi:hypothetical protein STEG23_011753 [Scotinomys teguina]